MTLGDSNYSYGAADTIDQNVGQYYHEYIAPYHGEYGAGRATNRFFPVLANHDWQAPGAQPYLDYFTPLGNERYYTHTLGPIQIFALDSDPHKPDGVSSESKQAAWLQEELAQSDVCWKIVCFHHAPFSSGLHGSSEWMRWPFEQWDADAVLAGHDHHYERIMRNGIPYFVNGLGGGAGYRMGEMVSRSEVSYNTKLAAMLIEARPDTTKFQFITVDGDNIDI